MVNLLQVSSAFGRTMETIDRFAMSMATFAPMKRLWAEKALTAAELDAAIASTAEGYSFPTNLDRDPPVGGLAPKTQQALLREAVMDRDARRCIARPIAGAGAAQVGLTPVESARRSSLRSMEFSAGPLRSHKNNQFSKKIAVGTAIIFQILHAPLASVQAQV